MEHFKEVYRELESLSKNQKFRLDFLRNLSMQKSARKIEEFLIPGRKTGCRNLQAMYVSVFKYDD